MGFDQQIEVPKSPDLVVFNDQGADVDELIRKIDAAVRISEEARAQC